MESIYKLMNAINDKESLNEKYNVKNIQSIKKLNEDYFEEDVDNDGSIMADYGFEAGENDMNDLYFYKDDSDDIVVTVHGNDAIEGVKCPDAGRVIKRPTKVTLTDGDTETVLGAIDAEYEVSGFADYYVLTDSRIEDKVWNVLNKYLKSQREVQNEGCVVQEEVDPNMKKLQDAAASVKCKLTPAFIEYAMEDPELLDDAIEDELLYCGKVLCDEFPEMMSWEFGEDDELTDQYGSYCVVESGTDEGRILVQVDGHGRIYNLE